MAEKERLRDGLNNEPGIVIDATSDTNDGNAPLEDKNMQDNALAGTSTNHKDAPIEETYFVDV